MVNEAVVDIPDGIAGTLAEIAWVKDNLSEVWFLQPEHQTQTTVGSRILSFTIQNEHAMTEIPGV